MKMRFGVRADYRSVLDAWTGDVELGPIYGLEDWVVKDPFSAIARRETSSTWLDDARGGYITHLHGARIHAQRNFGARHFTLYRDGSEGLVDATGKLAAFTNLKDIETALGRSSAYRWSRGTPITRNAQLMWIAKVQGGEVIQFETTLPVNDRARAQALREAGKQAWIYEVGRLVAELAVASHTHYPEPELASHLYALHSCCPDGVRFSEIALTYGALMIRYGAKDRLITQFAAFIGADPKPLKIAHAGRHNEAAAARALDRYVELIAGGF